jgi:hypothetical protein
MTIRDQGASILISLTTLGAALTSGMEARGTSITITGQQKPGTGDPPYDFIFDVTLQSGSPSIQTGDYFIINNLIGITPANFPAFGDSGSNATAPSGTWIPSIALVPNTGTVPPYASSVMWTFLGNSPISAPAAPVDLGLFTVETALSFSSPPYADGSIIYYTYNIGGQTSSGSGNFPLSSIPEPNSLVLLVIGAASALCVLPGYLRLHGKS